jgi:phage shock protein PspC (stress-responsive transcriptional regulator)
MTERLYRSIDDRIIAGVAGGLADYWGTDPSWIRVIWVVLAIITGGLGLLVYIVMAVVVPQEDVVMATAAPPTEGTAPPPTAAEGVPAPITPAAWRAERRARREARRAARGPGSFGMVVGAALVLIGIWYLLEEYVPAFDADRAWPFALIGLGVVLLAAAIARRPREPGSAA